MQPPINDNATLLESLFNRIAIPVPDSLGEYSLDGDDNWIPNRARVQAYCNRWRDRQQEYLTAVLYAVRNELARVQTRSAELGHPLEVLSGDGLSLLRIETYWEFSCSNPLLLVRGLEPFLLSYCEGDTERRHFREEEPFTPAMLRRREMNCLVLVAKVTPGIELVIYAKTNMRVRFEVRHYLPKITALRRRQMPQTCASASDALARLETITIDAAGVLNRFLVHLQAGQESVAISPSPVEFLFQCSQSATSARNAEAIVSALIANGGVVGLPNLAQSLDRMVRSGLIQRARNEQGDRSQMFHISPPYRHALEQLRSLSDAARLTAPTHRNGYPLVLVT